MTRIHVHLHGATRDSSRVLVRDEPKHDPKTGQFAAGSGGSKQSTKFKVDSNTPTRQVAVHHGWIQQKSAISTVGLGQPRRMEHPDHPGHVIVDPQGVSARMGTSEWVHYEGNKEVARGKSAPAMHKHLQNFHATKSRDGLMSGAVLAT